MVQTPSNSPLSVGETHAPPLKRGKQEIRTADARTRGGWEGFNRCHDL